MSSIQRDRPGSLAAERQPDRGMQAPVERVALRSGEPREQLVAPPGGTQQPDVLDIHTRQRAQRLPI